VEDKGYKIRFVTSYGKVGYGTIMAPDVDTASSDFVKWWKRRAMHRAYGTLQSRHVFPCDEVTEKKPAVLYTLVNPHR
jgi:hypothetical protein